MSRESYEVSVTSEDNPELAAAIEKRMKRQMNEGGREMEGQVAAFPGHDRQLSWEVGGDPEERLVGTVKVSGAMPLPRDLERDEKVVVQIINEQGELLAKGPAVVSAIDFKLVRGDVRYTERRHTVGIVED